MKQSQFEQDQEQMDGAENDENGELPDYYSKYDDPLNGSGASDDSGNETGTTAEVPSRQDSVTNVQQKLNCLPWSPKVRQKDIYQFLDVSRDKFIGYALPEDSDTTAGLPQPICEGVRILRQVNIYEIIF